MTLISLFMASTGIFCFVPISQRLVESGIVPVSSSWRFQTWSLSSVLAPTFYAPKEEKLRFLLAPDKAGNIWSEAEVEGHQMQSPPFQIPLYSADDTLDTDQNLAMPCANEWSAGFVSPPERSPANSFLPSTSIDTFDGCEYMSSISFTQDSTLCDSCNTLLRREIPPDHIPSVIRALALFEAQDRLSDVVFNEYEIAALTNAFSMLRL